MENQQTSPNPLNKGDNKMELDRKIVEIIDPKYVMEGAGVRLRRSIATPTLDYIVRNIR